MDLQEDDVLVAAANQALAARRNDWRYRKWTEDLAAHIAEVQQASEDTFRSGDFQQTLWDSEAISATGQGFIGTRPFWTDAAIVDCLWAVRNLHTSFERDAFTQELQRLWDEVAEKIQQRGSRVPRLKLARVFAALQSRHFTSLADGKALDSVGKSMHVGRLREGRAVLNQRILNRLDSVWQRIEVLQDEPPELTRMKLPWLLFKRESIQTDEEVRRTAAMPRATTS